MAAARLAMKNIAVPAVGLVVSSKGRMSEWQQRKVKRQEILLLFPMNSKSHETPTSG